MSADMFVLKLCVAKLHIIVYTCITSVRQLSVYFDMKALFCLSNWKWYLQSLYAVRFYLNNYLRCCIFSLCLAVIM